MTDLTDPSSYSHVSPNTRAATEGQRVIVDAGVTGYV